MEILSPGAWSDGGVQLPNGTSLQVADRNDRFLVAAVGYPRADEHETSAIGRVRRLVLGIAGRRVAAFRKEDRLGSLRIGLPDPYS